MLWQEELRNKGPSSASFSNAVWRFVRTRIIADCLVFAVTCILGFLTPVSVLKIFLSALQYILICDGDIFEFGFQMIFMRKLLEFSQDPKADIVTGLMWAFLLVSCEVLGMLSYSWRWAIAFRYCHPQLLCTVLKIMSFILMSYNFL